MVTIILILASTIPVLMSDIGNEFYIVIAINILTLLLLVSIILKTEYKIKSHLLYWQSGPFYGNIDIKTIVKIKHHNGIFVPTVWKPALSHIGLIITYNKYDDIYISPKNEEEFIRKLLELNPLIEIH